MPLQIKATSGEEHYLIINSDSPFYHKKAFRKKPHAPWYIPGNLRIATPWIKYKKGNLYPPGIFFDKKKDYPANFKKIYWEQNPLGEDSKGESNSEGVYQIIQDLLNKGFAVYCRDLGLLKWEGESMQNPHCINSIFLVHPKVEKAQDFLYKTIESGTIFLK